MVVNSNTSQDRSSPVQLYDSEMYSNSRNFLLESRVLEFSTTQEKGTTIPEGTTSSFNKGRLSNECRDSTDRARLRPRRAAGRARARAPRDRASARRIARAQQSALVYYIHTSSGGGAHSGDRCGDLQHEQHDRFHRSWVAVRPAVHVCRSGVCS